MNIIQLAKELAITAHGDQKRKYTGAPYWLHCQEVANIVESVNGSDIMIAAAWVHDVIEDTNLSDQDITQILGDTVAQYVLWMTDVDRSCGNRKTRKQLDCERLRRAPNEVKTIKLADIISNVPSIVEHDPNFARVYLNEKKNQLAVLKGGDGTLYTKASNIVYRPI